MFGYIQYSRENIKCCDLKRYNAFYCGVCKQIKNEFGHTYRLTLNYDIVFMSIILSAIYGAEEESQIEKGSCLLNPFKKRKVISNDFLKYSSHMNIILFYYKLMDDYLDDKSVLAWAGLKFMQRKYLKIKKTYPEKEKFFREGIERINWIEKSSNYSLDNISHEFGNILGSIFVYDVNHPKADVCYKIGYNIGRLIYILDCADDFEKDLKNKSFNPLNRYTHEGNITEELRSKLSDLLLPILSQLAQLVDTIRSNSSGSLINNIAFYGIRRKSKGILEKFGINTSTLLDESLQNDNSASTSNINIKDKVQRKEKNKKNRSNGESSFKDNCCDCCDCFDCCDCCDCCHSHNCCCCDDCCCCDGCCCD